MTLTALSAPLRQRDLREERKFPLSRIGAVRARAMLEAMLRPDPQYPEGTITTCYFDTPDLASYWEAADGEYAKRKLRLRWYGDPIDPYAGGWLELKTRVGQQSRKQRIRVAAEGEDWGGGIVVPGPQGLAELVAQLDPLAARTLRPTVLVRYRRRRWVDAGSGLRASLDTGVRAAPARAGFVWRDLAEGSVLELKSNAAPPERLRALTRLSLNRGAYSKYALAVEATRSRRDPRTR